MKGIAMYARIQELKQKGYSQHKVAKEENVSRGTVRKYWIMSEEEFAHYLIECKTRFKVLDPHRTYITNKLMTHSEITAAIIHDNLLEENPELEVSASAVREYVAVLREELGIPRSIKIRQYATSGGA